jgi:hypothetical protein
MEWKEKEREREREKDRERLLRQGIIKKCNLTCGFQFFS